MTACSSLGNVLRSNSLTSLSSATEGFQSTCQIRQSVNPSIRQSVPAGIAAHRITSHRGPHRIASHRINASSSSTPWPSGPCIYCTHVDRQSTLQRFQVPLSFSLRSYIQRPPAVHLAPEPFKTHTHIILVLRPTPISSSYSSAFHHCRHYHHSLHHDQLCVNQTRPQHWYLVVGARCFSTVSRGSPTYCCCWYFYHHTTASYCFSVHLGPETI